jgi:hypothetical protein
MTYGLGIARRFLDLPTDHLGHLHRIFTGVAGSDLLDQLTAINGSLISSLSNQGGQFYQEQHSQMRRASSTCVSYFLNTAPPVRSMTSEIARKNEVRAGS